MAQLFFSASVTSQLGLDILLIVRRSARGQAWVASKRSLRPLTVATETCT